MDRKVSKFLYWTPRILAIIFVCFLFLMSLDVFGNGLGFWQTVFALFIHNVPALILLVAVIISWKYEIVGGIIFILAGILYIILIIRIPFEWYVLSWVIQISGFAFVIGVLFIFGWYNKKKQLS